MRPVCHALLIVLLGGAAAACSRSSKAAAGSAAGEAGSAAAAAPAIPPKHFGDIMAEVGRRFERAGRAAQVGRWELAAYDVGEIEEVFADIPHAIMPEDVHIDLRPIAKAFADTAPGDLKRALAAHDLPAFEAAFARTAATCNGCHQAAGRSFIQVPTTIGEPVPRLDALDAAPGARAPAAAPAAP